MFAFVYEDIYGDIPYYEIFGGGDEDDMEDIEVCEEEIWLT